MKLSSKTLQNLPLFWNKRTKIVFPLIFQVHCICKSGLCYMKLKGFGFSYSKNVTNFEAFQDNSLNIVYIFKFQKSVH